MDALPSSNGLNCFLPQLFDPVLCYFPELILQCFLAVPLTCRLDPFVPRFKSKEFHALDRGSSRGGVSAVMDEIPYIRVFLKHHCRKYTMTGRTYRTGGFGFVCLHLSSSLILKIAEALSMVFPRGSAMVQDISRAVMKFTEGGDMYKLEKKWFGDEATCPDAGSPMSNQSLPLHSLRSIYIMIGVGSVIAFIVYLFRRCLKRRMMHNASNISMVTTEPNEAVEVVNTKAAPTNECPRRMNENQPKNVEDGPIGERRNYMVLQLGEKTIKALVIDC
ncbi:hypothetical protein ACLOJK_002805 [Asimina triloba]